MNPAHLTDTIKCGHMRVSPAYRSYLALWRLGSEMQGEGRSAAIALLEVGSEHAN